MLREAIILVGGFGVRLKPVVSDVPKPLAPVAGRPFLCWLLDTLARQGVERVILASGYMADVLYRTLGDTHGTLRLDHVREENPRGTGGALWAALRHSREERVLALNGDTWASLDLAALSAAHPQADIVIAAREIENRSRFGGLILEGNRVLGLCTDDDADHAPGPAVINAGVYVLRADLPERFPMPEKFSLEREIFGHARNYEIYAHLTDGAFLDIGTPADFERAQTLIPAWHRG
ncbi:NTP transferase domain-containing protein [Phaeovibrio sulfidiphilus]|uniref:NTP transferase domain-containing protein n=1 Tax=Phaeovibrio sulfidiphilus TaxID=1220600 RepID=A0A8J7CDL8_9PROT|nr:sugar phosphate nucleotidyltransferase [Phaeovibrio sulfidiphilus]MBE1237878.1 NTP transferase domain-containing protein [Phaeovibrio sulfidiphilus]